MHFFFWPFQSPFIANKYRGDRAVKFQCLLSSKRGELDWANREDDWPGGQEGVGNREDWANRGRIWPKWDRIDQAEEGLGNREDWASTGRIEPTGRIGSIVGGGIGQQG